MKLFIALAFIVTWLSATTFANAGDPCSAAGCNAYGCWQRGGGCNAYGCWGDGGGCNAYGCWSSPQGACNAYGCSDNGVCNAYGCP
jgi:hypothetical protein